MVSLRLPSGTLASAGLASRLTDHSNRKFMREPQQFYRLGDVSM